MSHAASTQPPAPAHPRPEQPCLRLVEDPQSLSPSAAGEPPPAAGLPDERHEDHVLVAGADAATRAHMLAELHSVLPEGTLFVEASETWEVVARAAGSRMVVIAGDLGEASSSSLLRLLARRHPALPVLAVGDSERRQALDAAHA
jgi:hypothetical protein